MEDTESKWGELTVTTATIELIHDGSAELTRSLDSMQMRFWYRRRRPSSQLCARTVPGLIAVGRPEQRDV